jgi:polysaccharide export outer membrane protein
MRIPFVLFLSAASAFAQAQPIKRAPADSGANLPLQSVGPNDLISVNVYDAPEVSRTIRIGSDGFLAIPMVKQRIKAAGLYPDQLESSIAAALSEEHILVSPVVTVTIAEYHSRPISVSGSVRMPIVFQAEGPTTLLDALARAQGLTSEAGRDILVSRKEPEPDGKTIMLTRRISVRTLFDDPDSDLNLTLTGGEDIRVPLLGKVYVMGNVKKPGAFPMQEGSDTTVMEMLALAEGLAPYAAKQAFIYRREGSGTKNEIPVPLEKIMKRQAPDVILTASDIFYIPDNTNKRVALSVLEKAIIFGTGAGTALIYAGR